MEEFLDHTGDGPPKELLDKDGKLIENTMIVAVIRTGNKDEKGNHLLGYSGPIPARLHDWFSDNHEPDTDSEKSVGAIVKWRLAQKDSAGRWEQVDSKIRWSERI